MDILSHLTTQRKKNSVLSVLGCQLNRIDNDLDDKPGGHICEEGSRLGDRRWDSWQERCVRAEGS